MKAQVNVRLSDAARHKLDQLTQRYGTQTTALEVAIDRLHRAECAMIHGHEAIQQEGNMVRIDWYPNIEDTDALYGAHDYHIIAGIDRDASAERFVSRGEQALRDAYPAAEIVVHRHGSNVPGTSATLAVDDLVDTVEAGRASDIVAGVWANMDGWVVARPWVDDDTRTVDDLSATDLRQEAAEIVARGDGPVQVATVTVQGAVEAIEVLHAPEIGRAGLAWGADAAWTDCESLVDAIERFLGDGMTG